MELDSKKYRRRERTMRSNSFETQEVRQMGRNEAGALRGLPILWIGMMVDAFQIEGKVCDDHERLKMCRRREMPEGGKCLSMG